MYLKSLKGCKLKIGRYPQFDYNAEGGGGKGIFASSKKQTKRHIFFDPKDFNIPSINWMTTKILGFPLPPGIVIDIKTERLEGYIDYKEMDISLEFEAKFKFSIGSIIYAPDLIVKTLLKNKALNAINNIQPSKSIDDHRVIVLKGIANVPPTGNRLFDNFLSLPNKAEAILNCTINGLTDY